MHNHIDYENSTPLARQLSQIGTIGASNLLGATNWPTVPQSVSVGAGRPPVPSILVKKSESGAFVEMTELLPERLGFVDVAR